MGNDGAQQPMQTKYLPVPNLTGLFLETGLNAVAMPVALYLKKNKSAKFYQNGLWMLPMQTPKSIGHFHAFSTKSIPEAVLQSQAEEDCTWWLQLDRKF